MILWLHVTALLNVFLVFFPIDSEIQKAKIVLAGEQRKSENFLSRFSSYYLYKWRFPCLKRHDNETCFSIFCINRFGIGSSLFDFGVKFADIFVIENRLTAKKDTGSRQEILTFPFFQPIKKPKSLDPGFFCIWIQSQVHICLSHSCKLL